MSVIGHVPATSCGKHVPFTDTDLHFILFPTYMILIQYDLLNTRVNAATGRSFEAKAQVFDSTPAHKGFVVDNVAVGPVFLQSLGS